MTSTAHKIAHALRLSGAVVYGRRLDGPGPALRGWYVLEPAGRWRWLGSTSRAILCA